MTVSSEDVTRLFGDIDAHRVGEIVASGATMPELEEVAAHLEQETDVMGKMKRPLAGRALRIYEMLVSDQEQWEEDR